MEFLPCPAWQEKPGQQAHLTWPHERTCRQRRGGETLSPGKGTLLWRKAPCPRVLLVPEAVLQSVCGLSVLRASLQAQGCWHCRSALKDVTSRQSSMGMTLHRAQSTRHLRSPSTQR